MKRAFVIFAVMIGLICGRHSLTSPVEAKTVAEAEALRSDDGSYRQFIGWMRSLFEESPRMIQTQKDGLDGPTDATAGTDAADVGMDGGVSDAKDVTDAADGPGTDGGEPTLGQIYALLQVILAMLIALLFKFGIF